jgi:hypothetical protein
MAPGPLRRHHDQPEPWSTSENQNSRRGRQLLFATQVGPLKRMLAEEAALGRGFRGLRARRCRSLARIAGLRPGQLAGCVGGAVVHEDDFLKRRMPVNRPENTIDPLALVVGANDAGNFTQPQAPPLLPFRLKVGAGI